MKFYINYGDKNYNRLIDENFKEINYRITSEHFSKYFKYGYEIYCYDVNYIYFRLINLEDCDFLTIPCFLIVEDSTYAKQK